MKISPLTLPGLFSLEIEAHEDERGLFARTFCEDELAAYGLETRFVQGNTSWNARRGTLRGLHYQAVPHGEAKIVRATRGRAFDVVVDLRAGSPTFGRTLSLVLDCALRNAIYIPRGFAHGFQSLEDDTELLYSMSTRYVPEAARGVRWDDPRLAIAWPIASPTVSARDASLPGLDAIPPGDAG